MVFLQIHNGSENISPSKNVTRDLLVLSLDYLLTKSEYFLFPDLAFDHSLECLELFPKHIIHWLIIIFHWNLWIGYCASVKQVLGPPFDKMSQPVTAQQACQIQSLMTQLTYKASDVIISENKHSNKCKYIIGSVVVMSLRPLFPQVHWTSFYYE